MSDKEVLRRALLEKRQAVEPDVRRQWDASIATQITALLATHPVRTLGIYWPIRSEPDLRPLYAELATCGVQLALPVVIAQDAPLRFAAWSPGEPLVKDALAVSIPANADNTLHPDALLIPCVGYNSDNVRLGYGGGFYDRTLATTPRPFTLGIAYSCAMAQFKGAPHDIPLDRIITELPAARDTA
ncbi:5-formyltetrahydrofolate cyclo-ligase [Noviherbaspirillum cavernae]|uniref:5-formyltetrahydrofolate cyclo-ligase n=1 Tax=Noviherbaspirillum cavernae TaxID=2320862 RepID=A0A418X5N9_9BURK|nr:5-formyltetrahydrofolate cyclo-ligase [Noviherbaspirillum cavernae]